MSNLKSEESTWVRCEGLLGQGRSGREEARGKGRASDGWKRSGVSDLCLCAAPAKKNTASATLGSDFSVEAWQETSPPAVEGLVRYSQNGHPPRLAVNAADARAGVRGAAPARNAFTAIRTDHKSVTLIFASRGGQVSSESEIRIWIRCCNAAGIQVGTCAKN